MYTFTNYTLKTPSKNESFKNELEKEFNEKIDNNGELINDEDSQHYDMYLLWEALEKITKNFPNEPFTIEGVYDTSSSAGELLDFKITYDHTTGQLTGICSDWYTEEEKCFYDDYQDFCEQNDEDNPPMTEDEFDQWDDATILFGLESGSGKWVTKVPLDYNITDYFPDLTKPLS